MPLSDLFRCMANKNKRPGHCIEIEKAEDLKKQQRLAKRST